MPVNVNIMILSGRIMRDPERRDFSNGGCIVSFGLGFLESSWFDKTEKKWKYKNGFVDVKKSFNGDSKPDYLLEIAKGMDVIIEGKLGYEEWDDKKAGGKRTKVVFVASKVTGLKASTASTNQENKGRSGGSSRTYHDAPNPDDDEGGNREDIPFAWLLPLTTLIASLSSMAMC